MKRVTIIQNGTDNSKVFGLPPGKQFQEFLKDIETRFQMDSKIGQKLFTSTGSEIDDCELIRDDEVLHAVYHGKAFSSPLEKQDQKEWIKLNVGGWIFETTRTTLVSGDPNSLLAKMFDPNSEMKPSERDKNGAYMIDRNGKYFGPILDYLRNGSLVIDPDLNPQGVLEEARFFGIEACIKAAELLVDNTDLEVNSLSKQEQIRNFKLKNNFVHERAELKLSGLDLEIRFETFTSKK